MPIVKILKRKCNKCEKMFIPTGKYNKLCQDCNPRQNNTYWHRLQRLSKKVGKKEEIKVLKSANRK